MIFSPIVSTKCKWSSHIWIADQKKIMLDTTISYKSCLFWIFCHRYDWCRNYRYSEGNNEIWCLIISLVIIIGAGEKKEK